jgi:hypothetical protein
MIGEVLEATAPVNADGIDICVALDDVSSLNLDAIAGNSLGVVRIPIQRAKGLVTGPRSGWSQFLSKRAQRSAQLDAGTSTPSAALLVSSLGKLDRLPWVSPRLHPASFLMFPTPTARTLNIILWSTPDTQALTMGVNADYASAASTLMSAVLRAWKDCIT